MKTFNQFLREFGLDTISPGLAGLKKVAGSSTGKKVLDVAQFGADVVGIVDPTPITDLANAAVSVGRGSIAKTPEEKKDHYNPWFMTTEQKPEYYKKLDEYEKYTVQVSSIQRDIDAEEKKLSDTQNRVSKLYGNIESANQRLLGPAQKAVNDVDKLKLNNDRLVQNLQNELKITALSSKVESIRSRFESNSINAQIIGDYYDDKILGMYTQAKIAKAMSPASLCIAMAAAKKDGKCPAESPQLSPPGGVLDEDANVGHSKK